LTRLGVDETVIDGALLVANARMIPHACDGIRSGELLTAKSASTAMSDLILRIARLRARARAAELRGAHRRRELPLRARRLEL